MQNPSQTFRNLTEPNYGRPKKEQNQALQELTRPHIDSFNYMLETGLTKAVQNITPIEFALPNGQRIALSIIDAGIASPAISSKNVHARTIQVYPTECRERGTSYKGKIQITLVWSVDGRMAGSMDRTIGEVPIMVKSKACNLHGLPPEQLVQHGEEAEEMGGYFVINGIEKIIRMLIIPRGNFPTAMSRPSWKNRGPQYTEYGVSMRSVMADRTAATIVLHYLNNGTANLSFTFRKEQFFVPIVMILKALVSVTDQHIYKELIKGKEQDSFYKGCMVNMLRQAQNKGLTNRTAILKYIGERFRVKLQLPDWYTDAQVGELLLRECVCIHLDSDMDKFNILVYMTRKLFAFAKGECANESADNPANQEVLLGGHLYLMTLKEKIEGWLLGLRFAIEKKAKTKGLDYTVNNSSITDVIRIAGEVSKPMEYLMATGNLVSKTGLGLMQNSGLTVVADKLNFMRYLSHFRCIHRGAFFAEMRTTAVRKLLPEAWGFLCPVHTPDGSPCGLMNHMSAHCQVVNTPSNTSSMQRLLTSLGMAPNDSQPPGPISECSVVMLDGKIMGWVHDHVVRDMADKLRVMKVQQLQKVPRMMEICLVPKTTCASQYAGLYLFTSTARMMRPVINLGLNLVEMIGTFEQVYMHICITPDEAHDGITTHQEINEQSMLSSVANLTPYSDFNQSPRNMYQCQMGKQTMGFPLHAYEHRSDNKLYRIQSPQAALVRPYMYDHYGLDDYPLGTNAIVAVISYTGYDMEDAMILNKGSYERGFCHGSIIKSEFIDLKQISRDKYRTIIMFGSKPGDTRTEGKLDKDGMPPIGAILEQGDPFYSYINVQTGEVKIEKYKNQESATVLQIKILGGDNGVEDLQKVCIVLRIQRNPVIGDKFASRHGQKGICSQKWPFENMPFSESGMTPDILFNPHGFPSRMTIGMMIESMAGKSAAMHGLVHDATPFTFSEDNPATDYFGRMMVAAGYNYYGTERLYSGVTGQEMEADIFMGIVYYQRLRHMVSDKFQVRTTGPVDQLTQQPVKGRKRAGGVRFGEMERDALLSHGTSFLLQDRLLHNSDKSVGHVCSECGSLLSTRMEKVAAETAAASAEANKKWRCYVCDRQDTIQVITIPYVFRYLVAELAAMNIKVKLELKEDKWSKLTN